MEPFAQCGRTAHVGEEDGNVYRRPIRRNSLTASRTQVGVLARLMKSKQPYQFAAESAERIMADFATRRAGQITEERVHHAKRTMSLDQNLPPELFGLRRRCGLCSHPVLAPPDRTAYSPMAASPAARALLAVQVRHTQSLLEIGRA